MHAFGMAVSAAAVIAMASAMFGVGMARMLWADDLKRARLIDEIRSRTEVHLRGTITALEKQIEILKH